MGLGRLGWLGLFWGPSGLRVTGSWGLGAIQGLRALEAVGLWWLGLLWGASGLRGTGSWGARVARKDMVARVALGCFRA